MICLVADVVLHKLYPVNAVKNEGLKNKPTFTGTLWAINLFYVVSPSEVCLEDYEDFFIADKSAVVVEYLSNIEQD